jgi:hypothetical protein
MVGRLGIHPPEDESEEKLVHHCVLMVLMTPHEEGDTVSGVPLVGC